MAREGPSLIKLSFLFLDMSEGLHVVFFLCLLAFGSPHPLEKCVNVTSSPFVFIYVCEYGLILLEQPKLSMYI